MKVAGSTALVTGANRGLGLAFAKVACGDGGGEGLCRGAQSGGGYPNGRRAAETGRHQRRRRRRRGACSREGCLRGACRGAIEWVAFWGLKVRPLAEASWIASMQ